MIISKKLYYVGCAKLCKTVLHKCGHTNKGVKMSKRDESEQLKHDFQKKTYGVPTFCDQCGQMLYGLMNQG